MTKGEFHLIELLLHRYSKQDSDIAYYTFCVVPIYLIHLFADDMLLVCVLVVYLLLFSFVFVLCV